MKSLHSKEHKEIVGSVNDVPYIVSFDSDGFAYDVEDAVADQLTSGSYGVTEVDEDGALVNKPADPASVSLGAVSTVNTDSLPATGDTNTPPVIDTGKTDEKDTSKKTEKKSDKGSVVE